MEILPLYESLLFDSYRITGIRHNHRDFETITKRFEHEGLSFLTITLPNFHDEVMNCVRDGIITPDAFPGWKKRSGIPVFLGDFLRKLFMPDLKVNQSVSPLIIKVIRQISFFCKKVKVDCTKKRISKALSDYIQIEDDLWELDLNSSSYNELFERTCSILWSNVFSNTFDFDDARLIPKNGPGVTAEGYYGNEKLWLPVNIPSRLLKYFSIGPLIGLNDEILQESNRKVRILDEYDEEPVKVITVPKTLKGPRIIAVEPLSMQAAQQAVKDYLVERIESHYLTKWRVNFSDQSINQKAALMASIDGQDATLDMSAASDRISYDVVKMMLKTTPQLLELLDVSRTRFATVCDNVFYLKKFASMGSATCFPVESMVFFSITIASILDYMCLPPTLKNIEEVANRIKVYGDDIIVPTTCVPTVMTWLSYFGNRVNVSKSFYTSSFRESCGCDAYAGIDVTPVYLRSLDKYSQKNIGRTEFTDSLIVSWVQTANDLNNHCFFRTSERIKLVVDNYVKGKFKLPGLPLGNPLRSPILVWNSTSNPSLSRTNQELQTIEVFGLQAQSINKFDPIHDELCKWNKVQKRQSSDTNVLTKSSSMHWKQGIIDLLKIDNPDTPTSSSKGASHQRIINRKIDEDYTPRRNALRLRTVWTQLFKIS
jgi:hypothetical protein